MANKSKVLIYIFEDIDIYENTYAQKMKNNIKGAVFRVLLLHFNDGTKRLIVRILFNLMLWFFLSQITDIQFCMSVYSVCHMYTSDPFY